MADILTRQSTALFWAMQQRNVQRLWELWCESAKAFLHRRTKQRLSTVKARTGRGEVRHSGEGQMLHPHTKEHKIIGHAGCSSWPDKKKTSSDNFTGTLRWLVVSVLFHGASSACGKNQAIWRLTVERSVLGCCEAASFPSPGAGEPLGTRSQGGSETSA